MPLGSTKPPPSDPTPAATLILARDGAAGPPEILLVERAAGLAFAGGAVVFPGGRVDAADRLLAADPALVQAAPDDPDDAAARVAAIRETVEEAGVAAGFAAPREVVGRLQAGLLAGRPFAALLAAEPLALDLAALVPWSRWRPHGEVTRRYDARFYLAAGVAAAEPRADAAEAVRAFWSPAAAVLEAAARGEASLIVPTRRNLERIAAHPDVAALVAHARATPVRTITPEIVEAAGGRLLIIPEGLGYPVTREPYGAGRPA